MKPRDMHAPEQPDIQHLIERARQGDETALRWLYETHRPRIQRLAVSLLGDGDEADDVMQDVMIYALRHLDRYQPERAAFGTWLHAIAVSRCRDRGRRAQRGLAGLRAWWVGHGEPTADPEDRVPAIDAAGALGPALATLTPLQREALALRAVSELSFQEIGEALGIPLRTAQTRVAGALAALRRAMPASGFEAEADDPSGATDGSPAPTAAPSAAPASRRSTAVGKNPRPPAAVPQEDGR